MKLRGECRLLGFEVCLNDTAVCGLPADPVRFCREWLGYEPYEYMYPFLRDRSHFVALLAARQTGKTFNGMAKLLWIGFRLPGQPDPRDGAQV